MRKITAIRASRLAAALMAVVLAGCGPNAGVLQSGKTSPVPPAAEASLDPFERDLADVKAADFTWLYVIRRRDGGMLNGEDKALIRAATAEANRRVVSDGERAVIVGSNYEASVAGAEKLKKDFDVTDLSTGRPAANTNVGNAQR